MSLTAFSKFLNEEIKPKDTCKFCAQKMLVALLKWMVKRFGLVWMHEACGTSKMDGKVL